MPLAIRQQLPPPPTEAAAGISGDIVNWPAVLEIKGHIADLQLRGQTNQSASQSGSVNVGRLGQNHVSS